MIKMRGNNPLLTAKLHILLNIPTTLCPSPGSQHSHWFPLGEWPTWPRPGKWHNWALLDFIYLWHYFKGWFAVLYLHDLITYACTKCIEMPQGLVFSPDQFTHIHPPSIWYITTPRYYFLVFSVFRWLHLSHIWAHIILWEKPKT